MRRVEIMEEVLRIGTQTYHAGDITQFEDDEAAEYIRLGWVKCVETGEQGERTPGAQRLQVDNVSQTLG